MSGWELDLGIVALGIAIGLFAPFVFVLAIMTGDAPGSSSGPFFTIVGLGLAAIALIAWLASHPLQFFGGIALPFAFLLASPIFARLRGSRKEIAQPEPPRQPVPCSLVWGGIQVSEFEAGEGLPPETDPNSRFGVQSTHGSADSGILTFRRGSTRNIQFVQWCKSRGPRLAANAPGAAPSIPKEIDVQISNDGKKVAEINLTSLAIRGQGGSRVGRRPGGDRSSHDTVRSLEARVGVAWLANEEGVNREDSAGATVTIATPQRMPVEAWHRLTLGRARDTRVARQARP